MQGKKTAQEREIDHPSLNPDVLANYRPISLLPFTSKVLDEMVVIQSLHLQRNTLD